MENHQNKKTKQNSNFLVEFLYCWTLDSLFNILMKYKSLLEENIVPYYLTWKKTSVLKT